MTNRLKRLIKKEFGRRTYLSLCTKALSMTEEKKDAVIASLYDELYEKLKDNEAMSIRNKLQRLDGAIIYIQRINKTYGTVVFMFAAAVLFILLSAALAWIKAAAIILLTVCLAYRSYEFYCNRFCILDLQIAVVYRKVLESLAEAD